MRPGEVELEEFKLKELKQRADALCEEIKAGIGLQEFLEKEKTVREFARRLYPEKAELYDLIYRSRFKRIWKQFRNREVEFVSESFEKKSDH